MNNSSENSETDSDDEFKLKNNEFNELKIFLNKNKTAKKLYDNFQKLSKKIISYRYFIRRKLENQPHELYSKTEKEITLKFKSFDQDVEHLKNLMKYNIIPFLFLDDIFSFFILFYTNLIIIEHDIKYIEKYIEKNKPKRVDEIFHRNIKRRRIEPIIEFRRPASILKVINLIKKYIREQFPFKYSLTAENANFLGFNYGEDLSREDNEKVLKARTLFSPTDWEKYRRFMRTTKGLQLQRPKYSRRVEDDERFHVDNPYTYDEITYARRVDKRNPAYHARETHSANERHSANRVRIQSPPEKKIRKLHSS